MSKENMTIDEDDFAEMMNMYNQGTIVKDNTPEKENHPIQIRTPLQENVKMEKVEMENVEMEIETIKVDEPMKTMETLSMETMKTLERMEELQALDAVMETETTTTAWMPQIEQVETLSCDVIEKTNDNNIQNIIPESNTTRMMDSHGLFQSKVIGMLDLPTDKQKHIMIIGTFKQHPCLFLAHQHQVYVYACDDTMSLLASMDFPTTSLSALALNSNGTLLVACDIDRNVHFIHVDNMSIIVSYPLMKFLPSGIEIPKEDTFVQFHFYNISSQKKDNEHLLVLTSSHLCISLENIYTDDLVNSILHASPKKTLLLVLRKIKVKSIVLDGTDSSNVQVIHVYLHVCSFAYKL